MKTFIDKCIDGEATPEEIDDYIEVWHTTKTNNELYEFLGITEREYIKWVITPSALPVIINEYINCRGC